MSWHFGLVNENISKNICSFAVFLKFLFNDVYNLSSKLIADCNFEASPNLSHSEKLFVWRHLQTFVIF